MDDTKVCPYCCEIIKIQAIRCKHCQADLRTASKVNASYGGTIGGAGGVTIGGRGHHVEGGIHIVTTLGELDGVDESVKHQLKSLYERQVRSSPENAKYHFALGLSYLDLRMYKLAIDALSKALDRGPREANILYYIALAYINGRRPKILKLSNIKSIENYLSAAIQLERDQAHYLYLWALIKYDYYLVNGLRIPPPSLEKLIMASQECRFLHVEVKQIFKHVPVPSNPIIELILRRGQS